MKRLAARLKPCPSQTQGERDFLRNLCLSDAFTCRSRLYFQAGDAQLGVHVFLRSRHHSFSFGFCPFFRLGPYLWSAFSSATAWALAPRIAARKGWALAGAGTLPKSKARVVTFGPYIAWRESLS